MAANTNIAAAGIFFDITDASDTLATNITSRTEATLTVVEDSDTLAADVWIVANVSLTVVDINDTLEATASITSNLLANDIASASLVNVPTVAIQRIILANDIQSASLVTQPVIAQRQGLLANDIFSTTSVQQLKSSTNGFYPAAFYGVAFDHLPGETTLAVAELTDVLAVAATTTAFSEFDFIAIDPVDTLEVDVTLFATGATLNVTDDNDILVVNATAVDFADGVIAVIDTSDTLAATIVIRENVLAADIQSSTSVSQPAARQSQSLLADDVVSTSNTALLKSYTNGFYPAAFYGVAFDHLPGEIILEADELADILAATVALGGFWDVVVGINEVSDTLAATVAITENLLAADVQSLTSVSQPAAKQQQSLLANNVVSASNVMMLEGSTNGFYPAAFYGVAFDHLPGEMLLAVSELTDVLAITATMVGFNVVDLTVTDTSDTLTVNVITITNIALAVIETADVFAIDTDILATFADLSATDTADTLEIDAVSITYEILQLDFSVTEGEDAAAFELNVGAFSDLTFESNESPDTLSVDLMVGSVLDLAVVEDADVLTAKLFRGEFFYPDSEGIRVAWENQSASVPGPMPEEPVVEIANVLTAFYETGFYSKAFFAGEGGFVYDADDEHLVHVPWAVQKLLVEGRPRGPVSRVHAFVRAFNEQAFYPPAFFTGSGGHYYDDNEAIAVPPAHVVVERLREDRKSFVEPRLRH